MRGRKPNVVPGPGAGSTVEVKRPTALMGDKVACAEWRRIVEQLQVRGLWDKCDQALVIAYCEAYSDFVRASNELRLSGIVIMDARGSTKGNPAVRVKKDASDRLVRYLAEMGLTPTGSVRAGGGGELEDELTQLLRKLQGEGVQERGQA